MKLFNATSGMNPIQEFIVANSAVITAGNFVKLSAGYLIACVNNDTACIGRALASVTQVADVTAAGLEPWQPYTCPVAVAYPGVSYDVNATCDSTHRAVQAKMGIPIKLKVATLVQTADMTDPVSTPYTSAGFFVPVEVITADDGSYAGGVVRCTVARGAFQL